jgi:outer membrane lipoprotein SlyB
MSAYLLLKIITRDVNTMTKRVITALSATLAIALVGCASTDPMTGSTRNEIISVQYGRIENIQQVAMAPSYGTGALIGGALGLLATATHSGASQVAATAAGAGLGALVAKETAGSAEKFTVRLVNNSTIDIVTENQDIQLGDCVSVEQGQHANIRRVSSVMCTTPASDPAYQTMNTSAMQESSECQAAKQELLKATTTEQTDISYKKMRAFCES